MATGSDAGCPAERDALREEVARLNQEIRRRQMELDILKKAEEIIKKSMVAPVFATLIFD